MKNRKFFPAAEIGKSADFVQALNRYATRRGYGAEEE